MDCQVGCRRREDVSHLRLQDKKKKQKQEESKNAEVRQKLCWKRNRLVKFISEVVLLLKYSRMGAVRICSSALDTEADGRVFSNIAAIVKSPSFAPDEHLIYWRRAVYTLPIYPGHGGPLCTYSFPLGFRAL